MVCIICKYFKFLALLSSKIQVISIKNSCSNNIFITLLICRDFFSSFWLKNLFCKAYLVIWCYQLISLSPLSEIDSYKLRNKCAKFWAFYKMCTIISLIISIISITIMNDILQTWTLTCNLRPQTDFARSFVNTIHFGLNSLRYVASKV